jgi:hypothetical protein
MSIRSITISSRFDRESNQLARLPNAPPAVD